MLKRKNNELLFILATLLLFSLHCKVSNDKVINKVTKDSDSVKINASIINCYRLKPVFNDSKFIEGDKDFWPGYNSKLKFSAIALDSFLKTKILAKKIPIDTYPLYQPRHLLLINAA